MFFKDVLAADQKRGSTTRAVAGTLRNRSRARRAFDGKSCAPVGRSTPCIGRSALRAPRLVR